MREKIGKQSTCPPYEEKLLSPRGMPSDLPGKEVGPVPLGEDVLFSSSDC